MTSGRQKGHGKSTLFRKWHGIYRPYHISSAAPGCSCYLAFALLACFSLQIKPVSVSKLLAIIRGGLFTGQMPFLSPNQQHQSTKKLLHCSCKLFSHTGDLYAASASAILEHL